MKVKRAMPLSEALDEIVATAQQLKAEDTAKINGQKLNLDSPVLLEIESESKKGKGELEFEIKWPVEDKKAAKAAEAEKKPRGRGRKLLIGAALIAAIGAFIAIRSRQNAPMDEEEYQAALAQ